MYTQNKIIENIYFKYFITVSKVISNVADLCRYIIVHREVSNGWSVASSLKDFFICSTKEGSIYCFFQILMLDLFVLNSQFFAGYSNDQTSDLLFDHFLNYF
jgi:hypothetical protein